ncbi:hypothetical protein [Glycomyces harbinensis]|uniref:Secreted protein n=1 Tax=Glycomyces harbinensis TaxID=58114 RepID=A0A1G7BNQ0_9ACTN|nr:hypothetical protein [Glycomyces harbinensis]SDE28076.1 hypothetical protein SAMN05216270_11740 [Glycomyces harbinensis]
MMRSKTRGLLIALMSAFVLAISSTGANAGVSTESPSGGSAPTDVDTAASWDCYGDSTPSSSDDGGRNMYSTCVSSNDDRVTAYFHAYDEIFSVCDWFPNGHHTVAKLTVGGETYTRKSDGTNSCISYDLNLAEGQAVKLEVRTSSSSNAVDYTQTGGRT